MNVPHISEETGISTDYWNEYSGKSASLELDEKYVVETLIESPIKKYEQRFPSEKYENVITPQNKAGVKRLNELSDIVNNNFKNISTFNETDFKRAINEAYNLIYAKGDLYLDIVEPETIIII